MFTSEARYKPNDPVKCQSASLEVVAGGLLGTGQHRSSSWKAKRDGVDNLTG